jgi:hypothetical protein
MKRCEVLCFVSLLQGTTLHFKVENAREVRQTEEPKIMRNSSCFPYVCL